MLLFLVHNIFTFCKFVAKGLIFVYMWMCVYIYKVQTAIFGSLLT